MIVCLIVDTTLASLYCCTTAVFSELHDQLANAERAASLTRYLSALAELLVKQEAQLLL